MSKVKRKWRCIWQAEVFQFHFFLHTHPQVHLEETHTNIILWKTVVLWRYYFNITKWCVNSCCTTFWLDMTHKYITGNNTGQEVRIRFRPADVLRLHGYDTDTLCHKLASGNLSQDVGNKIPIGGRVQMKPRLPGQHMNAWMLISRRLMTKPREGGVTWKGCGLFHWTFSQTWGDRLKRSAWIHLFFTLWWFCFFISKLRSCPCKRALR